MKPEQIKEQIKTLDLNKGNPELIITTHDEQTIECGAGFYIADLISDKTLIYEHEDDDSDSTDEGNFIPIDIIASLKYKYHKS